MELREKGHFALSVFLGFCLVCVAFWLAFWPHRRVPSIVESQRTPQQSADDDHTITIRILSTIALDDEKTSGTTNILLNRNAVPVPAVDLVDFDLSNYGGERYPVDLVTPGTHELELRDDGSATATSDIAPIMS